MSGPRPCVHAGIPEQARHLIWDTFFVRAARGVDFAAHLPWHADPVVRSILLQRAHGDVVAAAIILPGKQAGVAMVGFVCVDEGARGRGYGRDLIAAVNTAIDDAGYRAALLWTGKPAIYARQGYDVIGWDDLLRVTRSTRVASASPATTVLPWPGLGDRAGLPAFATSARRLRSDRGEAVVAQGPRGATLISWHGAPADIVAMLDDVGYAAWTVNVSTRDRFLAALPADRFIVRIEKGAATMARRSNADFHPDHVPVAERI